MTEGSIPIIAKRSLNCRILLFAPSDSEWYSKRDLEIFNLGSPLLETANLRSHKVPCKFTSKKERCQGLNASDVFGHDSGLEKLPDVFYDLLRQ